MKSSLLHHMYGFSGWLVVLAVLIKTPSAGAGFAQTSKPVHFLQRRGGVTAGHEQNEKIAGSEKAAPVIDVHFDEARKHMPRFKLVPAHFLQSHGQVIAVHQQHKRSVRTDQPVGFHFDEDPAHEADANLDHSIWYGASMANEFRLMDNLNPVAPYDEVAHNNAQEVIHEGSGKDAAKGMLFVPQYLIPDAFPAIEGSECMCQIPDSPGANVKCDCPMSERGANHLEVFHWAVEEPVPGTKNFTVRPADITFSDGNYWQPPIKDGLVAPEDRLPEEDYPIQALGDHLPYSRLPVSAREDEIPRSFARYIDQVETRKRQCDTVSKNCTTNCAPGEPVLAKVGNTQFNATVVSTHLGNAITIQFEPVMALTSQSRFDCTLQSSCSIYRFCVDGNNQCVEIEDKMRRDSFGNVQEHHECPPGTEVCKSVQQVVSATTLSKGGKACKAVPGPPSPWGGLR